jgi:hypothetical protein
MLSRDETLDAMAEPRRTEPDIKVADLSQDVSIYGVDTGRI